MEGNESINSFQNNKNAQFESTNSKQIYTNNCKSDSSSTMHSANLIKKKTSSTSSYNTSNNYNVNNKQYVQAEIPLDNNTNVILEDYEEGESMTWYKKKDTDEITGNEILLKNEILASNVQPQVSKLHHEKISDIQKYLIKDLQSGHIQDIRNNFEIQNLKNGSNVIPRNVNMQSCWKKWWDKKKEVNKSFLKACSLNYNDKIMELLNQPEKDLKPYINQVDDNGFSPLHYAANFGNLQIGNLLISNDCELEIPNYLDQTPLLVSVYNNHEQLAVLLIIAGANVNAQDIKQNTPLHYAFMNGNKTIIEALMRKPKLIPDLTNIEDKLAYEMSFNSDLLRLYNNLMQKRIKMKEQLEKNKVVIVDQTNKEIHNRFSSGQKLIQQQQQQQNKQQNHLDSQDQQNIDDFEVIGQIGKGSFGEVFVVKHRVTHKKYALKMLRKTELLKQQMMKYAFTERNVLSQSNHPFVAKLNYAFQTKNKLFLVMDYGQLGDLGTHLEVERRFDEEKTRFYSAQILLAVEHLHERDVIYRDLKSDNIIVCEDGYIMLTDFGLAKENVREFSHGAQSFCGSMAYMPPEMLKQSTQHGKSIDLYLFGVLLFELLTGTPPFFSIDRQTLFNNIQFSQVKFPQYMSKSAKSLIQKLLQKDPRFRPTYDEVKKHPFFKSIDWQKLYRKEVTPPAPVITKEKYKKIYVDIFNDYEEDCESLFNEDLENSHAEIKQGHLQAWTFVENEHQLNQQNDLQQQKYQEKYKQQQQKMNNSNNQDDQGDGCRQQLSYNINERLNTVNSEAEQNYYQQQEDLKKQEQFKMMNDHQQN